MDDRAVSWMLADVGNFSRAVWPDKALRGYQLAPARAIVAAAVNLTGGMIVPVFSRQSGKDEMLAQVYAYLLTLYQYRGGEIVTALPSLIPQGQISRQRLTDRLADASPLLSDVEGAGDEVRVGRASVRYMSAGPGAQARGATASLLLVANEAQDIEPDRWDAVFDPMGASTNCATVMMGTPWTNDTLLARSMLAAKGTGTLYLVDWQRVAAELPAYGARVRSRIATLGLDHPFIRTEYRLLTIDGAGRLFDATRVAQMHGEHARYHQARPGRRYALLLDVAGEEEEATDGLHRGASERGHRDSTVLTVVDIDAPAAGLPTYRVVDRRVWMGANHVGLAAEIADLSRRIWGGARVVVDATGIGHGLAALLRAALGESNVTPFVFSSSSKSELGWKFLAIIGGGRFLDYKEDGAEDTRTFWRQVAACDYTVRSGPGRLMQWSVADADVHDDHLLSAALVGALEGVDLRPRTAHGRAG
jgi:hypothetical protein